MKRNRSKNLPTFRSVNELVAFFETHDMGEYWDKLPKADFEVNLKKRVNIGNSQSTPLKKEKEFSVNTGKRWTVTQVKQLRQLASQNTPTRIISLRLGRTENAVRTKASEKGVSLKSKNHSSFYGRKK